METVKRHRLTVLFDLLWNLASEKVKEGFVLILLLFWSLAFKAKKDFVFSSLLSCLCKVMGFVSNLLFVSFENLAPGNIRHESKDAKE